MRVIGVIDLLHGRAVHASRGDRRRYQPIACVAGSAIPPGDPLALARAYIEGVGLTELYVADLDAILGRLADAPGQIMQPNDATVAALAALGAPLWLDAGITTARQAKTAAALGASRVVVGLETLRSFDALHEISAAVGSGRIAFSLDLKNGVPMAQALEERTLVHRTPARLAASAVAAGAETVIVIDVARVGAHEGPDFDLMADVRGAVPRTHLLAGGGVRGLDDLLRLGEVGCDGALIATAAHSGALNRETLSGVGQTQSQQSNAVDR